MPGSRPNDLHAMATVRREKKRDWSVALFDWSHRAQDPVGEVAGSKRERHCVPCFWQVFSSGRSSVQYSRTSATKYTMYLLARRDHGLIIPTLSAPPPSGRTARWGGGRRDRSSENELSRVGGISIDWGRL